MLKEFTEKGITKPEVFSVVYKPYIEFEESYGLTPKFWCLISDKVKLEGGSELECTKIGEEVDTIPTYSAIDHKMEYLKRLKRQNAANFEESSHQSDENFNTFSVELDSSSSALFNSRPNRKR